MAMRSRDSGMAIIRTLRQPRRARFLFIACMALSVRDSVRAADSAYLYGIHFWGLAGSPVDNQPCLLLDCDQIGGWDTEVVLTHGVSFSQAPYFQPYYQDLYTNKHITFITRIDYNWGQ